MLRASSVVGEAPQEGPASVKQQPKRAEIWAALAIVYVVWGSTYLGIKLAVRTLPPVLTAGTRFLVAGALLALVLTVLRHSLRVTAREALGASWLGIMLLGAGVGMVHVAEQRIDSGVAAMIAGSVPLQVVVWRTLAGDRVKRGTAAAALVGLLGLALIVVPGGVGGGSSAIGLLIMLGASLSWSRGSFISHRLTLPRDPFVATTIQMLAGGLVLLVLGSALGEWSDVTREALQAGPIAAWAYLAVAGSMIGFTAYAWLLRVAPISQVVTHQYVNPLVAVALGAVVLGERPGVLTAVGAALIVGAVVVTVSRESRAGRTAAVNALGELGTD
jgi:drug/metabolite transporter (DMT)-like permease